GKGGHSDTIAKQADDALTARELIKGKVLETAPLTSREAAETLAQAVNAEVVQVIGRTFVLYRANEKEPQIVLPKKK
ncbi:MAG: YhbY family RNA-binding protein, partial [Clostridia bacterium]|nr:YhbY family RNA-binding protein [Clostridia bacterium]